MGRECKPSTNNNEDVHSIYCMYLSVTRFLHEKSDTSEIVYTVHSTDIIVRLYPCIALAEFISAIPHHASVFSHRHPCLLNLREGTVVFYSPLKSSTHFYVFRDVSGRGEEVLHVSFWFELYALSQAHSTRSLILCFITVSSGFSFTRSPFSSVLRSE